MALSALKPTLLMHVNAFGLLDLKITTMRWNQRYVFGRYLRSSLWVVPFFSIPLALIAVRMLLRLDIWLGWSLLGLDTAGAKTLLEAFVSATLAFVVFTFGSLLVAIQVASAQLTPRIIADARPFAAT